MTQATEDVGVLESLRYALDSTTVGRVFGTPVREGGVVLLPVAKIGGGGGGGVGNGPSDDEHGQPEGSGGGFGVSAKPLGVFVLKDGKVSWRPAVDVNRIVLGGQVVAITALLVIRSLLRSRRAGRSLPGARRMRAALRR